MQEERGRQRMRGLDGINNSMDMSLSNSGRWRRTGKPGVLQAMGLQRVGHDGATEHQDTEAHSRGGGSRGGLMA